MRWFMRWRFVREKGRNILGSYKLIKTEQNARHLEGSVKRNMIGLAKVFKEKNSFPLEKGCSWSVVKFARDLVAGV